MNFAIIVAAGKSKRMGRNANKVFLPLLNKPMLYYTIKAFQDCDLVDEIIVVIQKEYFKKFFSMKKFFNFDKITNIIEGGEERQNSVYNGLMSIKNGKKDDIVVVHNGSNPLVKESEIIECINAAKKYGAAASGFPLKDTIKKISDNFVEKTIERKDIYQIQTPQAVKYGLFVEAFKNAKKENLEVTDDVSLVEALGKKVKIVACSYENIKITTEDDLKIAEGILMKRMGKNFPVSCERVRNELTRISLENFFRIGFGHDSHKFFKNKNKKMVLGGYVVPNEIGLEANSDGDVILHALFNAISSAIGERSLGFYCDVMCKKGITDSKEYLKVMLNKLNQKKLCINNVSISIEAKKPGLEKHTDKIKSSLSRILELDMGRIGITYTTGENLTSFGHGKGMQCFVVVSLIWNFGGRVIGFERG